MLQLVRGRRGGPRPVVLLLRLLTVCGVLLLGLPLPIAYAVAELPSVTGPFADAGGAALSSPSSDSTPVWVVDDNEAVKDARRCWLGQGAVPVPNLIDFLECQPGASVADPWVFTAPTLTDGTWTFAAAEYDGSAFGPMSQQTYIVDATAPVVTVTAPTSPSAVESVDWTVSLDEDGTTTCTLTRTAPTASVPESVACAEGTVTTSLAGKVEGTYQLSVVGKDTAGNTGVAASATYQLDRVPGAATVTATPTVGTSDTAVFTVSPPAAGADGPATLICVLRLGAATVATPDCTTSPVSVGGLTTDGDYVLTVTATDGSGSTKDSSATYARDTAAPTVTFTAGPSGSGQAGSLAWSWTVDDAHPVAAGSCALYLDGALVSTTSCSSPHTETVTGQGVYSLRVTASDAAGNDSAETTSPATYLRDTVVPVVTTTVDRTSPTRFADVTFGASVDDPAATLQCRLERTAPTALVVYDWTTCPIASTTLPADGSYLFSARATDDGQTGTASRTLVLDQVAPDAPTITRAWSTPTNDAALTWGLSAPATGDTRTCRFTQDAGTPTAYASCSTSVSFPVGATSGLWVLEVRDVDEAGNELVTAAPTVELDLVAPAQPVFTSQPSGTSSQPSVSWGFGFPTGTPADAGTTFECRLTGPMPADGFDWTACATPFPQVLPTDGSYVLELRARDDAGNLSALPVTTSSSYVLDRVAPPTPVVVGPSGTGRTTAVQWSFSPAPADSTTDDVTRAVCTRYYEGAPVETVDPCASPLARTLTDDGLHRLDVVLYDAADNPSTTAASAGYLRDTAAPVAPTVSALTGPAPSSTPAIQWTWSTAESLLAPARAECRLLRDGVLLGPDFTAPCALPRTDSGLTDGSYVLEVRVVDAAGNVGATGRNAVGYVIDTGAPAVPTFPGAPTGASTSTSISWTISAESGAVLSCRLVRNDDRSGAFSTCTSPYSATGLADSSYVLEAFATDAAGNAGGVGTSPTRVVDTAGPVLAAVAGPSGNGNVRRAEWSWVAPEASTTAECQLRQNGAVFTAWAACTTPYVVNLPGGDAAVYYLEVRLTDSLLNTGPAQASPSYALKTTLPVAPTVTPQASPSNDTTPVWTFSTQAGTTAECRLDRNAGTTTTTGSWVPCGTPYSRDLSDPLTGGGDATYVLSVRLSDTYGNTGPETAATPWVLDTAAPAAPALVLSPTGPSQDDTPTWSWTGESGATGRCSLNGGAVVDCASPFTPTLPADGTWVLAVALRDAAGNTSAATTAVGYVLDRVAPAAPVAVAVETSPIRVRSASWTLPALAGGDSRSCRVTLDGATFATYPACGTTLGPVALGGDGGYRVEAVDTDQALNASPTGTSAPLVLDTVVPGVPTLTAAPSGSSPQTAVSWSFTVPSDATAQCRLERDGGVVEDWAACASPLARTLTTDGSHVLLVRSVDAAGNLSAEVRSATYLLDRVAPAAPVVAGPSGDASTTAVRWTWTAEAGASVTCVLRRDGAVVETLAPCASPIDRVLAVDGTWRLDVVAADAAGNVGPAASSPDYRLDTALPVAPTVTGATGPTSATTATWLVTAEAGRLECRLRRDGAVVQDWSGPCATPVVRTLSGDGGYELDARVVDAAGNVGLVGTSPVLVHDTLAPTVPVVTGLAGPRPSPTTTWDITADAGTAQECRLLLGGVAQEPFAPCGLSVTRTLASDGDWQLEVVSYDGARNPSVAGLSPVYSLDTVAPDAPTVTGPTGTAPILSVSYGFTVPAGHTASCVLRRDGVDVVTLGSCLSPLPRTLGADGSYLLAVRLTDAAGNTGPEGTSPTYVLDTAPPGTPVVTGPTGPSQSRAPVWVISGEAVTATCRVLRGAVVVSDAPCLGSLTGDLTAEPDGSYVLEVVTRDLAGNASAAGTSAAYVLDTTAPVAPVVTGPTGPSPDAAPVFAWTGESGTTATCAYTLSGPTPLLPPVACTSPTTAALPSDGAWALQVQLTDAAGNTSLVGSSGAYLLDTTAPVAPVVTPPAPTGRDRLPTWGVTAEPGATLECRVTGPALVRDWSACTAPVDVDLAGQPDGSYVLAVRATDAAGLTGAVGSGTYLLDTVAPAAPVVTGPATGRSTSPSFAFTGEAGTVATCRLFNPASATPIQTVQGCTSPVPVGLSGLPDGPYSLNVRLTDAAGNTGFGGLATYVLDTTAPAAPVFLTRPASPSPDRAPSWSFTVEGGSTPVCRLVFPTGAVRDLTGCASPLPVDLTGLPDGTYTLQVRAVDPVGNSSAAAVAAHVLDSTAIAPPVVTAPVSPSADAKPTFLIVTPSGSTAECRLEAPGVPVTDVFSPCPSSTYGLTLYGQPSGAYRLSVRARTSTGLSAVASATYLFDVDDPAAPTVTGPPSPSTVVAPIFVVASPESGATAECRLLLNGFVERDWSSCAVSQAGAQNVVATRGDGSYEFRARVTDAAGNTGPDAGAVFVLSTQAAPAVTVQPPPSPGVDTTPSWTISTPAGTTLECQLTGPGGVVVPLGPCAGDGRFTPSLTADGSYSLTVHAVTASGAVGPDSTSPYTLSRAVPDAPTQLLGPTGPSAVRVPQYTFQLPPGTTAECTVVPAASAVPVFQGPCPSPYDMDLTAVEGGLYSLTVRAVSESGVRSAPTPSLTYALLTEVPQPAVFTLEPGSPSSSTAPEWRFSFEGGTPECRIEEGVRVLEDFTACSDGVQGVKTVNLGAEPDGTYSLVVRVRNDVGVSRTVSSDYAFDRSAVGLPVLAAFPPSPGKDDTPTWGVQVPSAAAPGTAVRCAMAVGSTTPTAGEFAGCGPTWTPTLAGDGVHVLWAQLVEPSGRTGAAVRASYTLDKTAPAAPVLNPAGLQVSQVTLAKWTWDSSSEPGLSSPCTVRKGATMMPSFPNTNCPAPLEVDLSSTLDGSYELAVKHVDPAGNDSALVTGRYTLDTVDPVAVGVVQPATTSGVGTAPTWTFGTSETVVAATCQTLLLNQPVGSPTRCSTSYTMSLAGLDPGTYHFQLTLLDAAGNSSTLVLGSYQLIAAVSRLDTPVVSNPRPVPPVTGTGGGVPGGGGPGGGDVPGDNRPVPNPRNSPPPLGSRDVDVPRFGSTAAGAGDTSGAPDPEAKPTFAFPGRALRDVQVPQAIADAVAGTFQKPQLPLALLVIVVLFLLVQNRIDRRDPKLAGAPAGADDDLTFGPAFRPGGAPA